MSQLPRYIYFEPPAATGEAGQSGNRHIGALAPDQRQQLRHILGRPDDLEPDAARAAASLRVTGRRHPRACANVA